MTTPNSLPSPDESIMTDALVTDPSVAHADELAAKSLAERIAERIASRFG